MGRHWQVRPKPPSVEQTFVQQSESCRHGWPTSVQLTCVQQYSFTGGGELDGAQKRPALQVVSSQHTSVVAPQIRQSGGLPQLDSRKQVRPGGQAGSQVTPPQPASIQPLEEPPLEEPPLLVPPLLDPPLEDPPLLEPPLDEPPPLELPAPELPPLELPAPELLAEEAPLLELPPLVPLPLEPAPAVQTPVKAIVIFGAFGASVTSTSCAVSWVPDGQLVGW